MEYKVSQNTVPECIPLQDYFRYEFILEELEMIRNYFPRELKEVIPHAQKLMGTYEIELYDLVELGHDRKEIKLRWVYTMDYPKQPAKIKPLDITLPKHLELKVVSMINECSSASCEEVFVLYELFVKLY